MSYEVRINGEPVDLPPATPVKLDWQSPYLLYDSIPGSQDSLPAFPATERNQRIFGYFHEPQSGPRIAEFTCQQFYGGELLKEGYFILTDADLATGYKGVFSDKLGEFFGDSQKVLLSELELGELPLELPTSGEVYQGGQLAYVLPTIVNSDFYGGNNPPGFSGRVNDYQAGQYVENSPRVPLFMVSFVLNKIAQLTGTIIEGEFFEHESWSRLAIYNTRAVQTGNVLVSGHLPDLTIQQFLLELRKLPNLAFTFDSPRKCLRIDFWEKKLALPTSLDWTKKAERGEVKTAERNARLQLSYELDSGDALQKDKPAAVADYFSPLLADDGRNGLAKLTPCKFSTLLTDEETGLATAKQKGNTSEYGQGSEKFTPRLLFWHGIKNGFPTALPSHESVSLYWNGENGLAVTSWKNTEAFRRNWFYLKKDFVLTESDLAQLDFSRKIHIGGMDYLLASLSIDLPIKSAVRCLLISV